MDFVQNKGFNLTLNFMVGSLNLTNKCGAEFKSVNASADVQSTFT
jgi:hypothetical protein